MKLDEALSILKQAGLIVESADEVELNISRWTLDKSRSEYNRNLYFDEETQKCYLEVCDEDYGDYLYYLSNAYCEEIDYIGFTNYQGSADFILQNMDSGFVMKLDPSMPT
jgi:hypothetical protein